MLNEILKYIRNYFPIIEKKVSGEFNVSNKTLSLPFLLSGQYFLVEGSVFNDGVHQYPDLDMTDETFSGTITPLAIPKEVVEIANDVAEYQASYKATPYQSESFGGYSYTRSNDSWKDAFKSRLSVWRKL